MKRLLIIIFFMSTISVAAEIEQESEKASEAAKSEQPALEPMGTEKKAVDLINKIIKGNQSFSLKIANPLLPGKIRLWQQRGLIRYPTKLTPWVTFRRDIEKFGSNLHTLLSKDPHTNSYYHIDALRKNHALYKSFEVLEKNLKEHEPKIEFTQPFKLGKESLESMQKLIDLYGTKLYQDKMLEQLAGILKSFDTKAKEIRTSQEKEHQAAQKPGTSSSFYSDSDFDDIFSFDDVDLGESSSSSFDLEDLGFDDDFIASFFE